jgi:ABC-2 type transport system permease protein
VSGRALFRQVFSLQVRKFLAYRADFWINFVMTVGGNLAISYFLWRSVFASRGGAEMGGYGFDGMIFYYLMVPLVDRMVRGPELSFISQDIYDGSLNRYLVYPVPFFRYKFAAFCAESFVSAVQLVLAVAVFVAVFGIPPDVRLSVFGFVLGFALSAAAIVTYFVMASILECVAFWADNSWSVIFSLRLCIFFFGGGLFPLSILPGAVQDALPWTPFPYFLSWPIRAFLGRLPLVEAGQGFLAMAAWTIAFAAILRIVWRKGLKGYAGVGI